MASDEGEELGRERVDMVSFVVLEFGLTASFFGGEDGSRFPGVARGRAVKSEDSLLDIRRKILEDSEEMSRFLRDEERRGTGARSIHRRGFNSIWKTFSAHQ